MADEIPEWAKERAVKLANADVRRGDSPTAAGGWTVEQVDRWTSLRAFARYIAEHEEPPVDPLMVEAREIVAGWWESGKNIPGRGQYYREGRFDGDAEVQQALAALKRGMELAK